MSNLIQLSQNLEDMAEFEALPEGLYPAECQDVEVRHSEKVPNGFLYIQFRISPEDFPADYDVGNAPEGLSVVYASVKIPDATNRRTVKPFKRLAEAFGSDISSAEFDPQEWVGKQVQVLLRKSEYQGSEVNNVDSVAPLATV